MKKYLLSFSLLIISLTVFGQQPGQYTMYMLDPFRFNPAYAGLDHSLSGTASIRSQWSGLEGNPIGQRIGVHLPLYFLSGGVGLQLERDEIGAHERIAILGGYNFQRDLGNGILSLGVGGGLYQWTFDGSRLRTPDGIYNELGVFSHEDILLSELKNQGDILSFSAGLFYQSETFEGGISLDHVTSPSVDFTQVAIKLSPVYYGYFAAKFELGRSLLLKPSIAVRSDAIETQTDFSLLIQHNSNIFGGVSFRGYSKNSNDALAIILGFNLNENLLLAYSYDIALSTLNSLHSGSHEFTVKYNLNKAIGAGKPPRIIYHPRAQ